jgi:hypothetical protein
MVNIFPSCKLEDPEAPYKEFAKLFLTPKTLWQSDAFWTRLKGIGFFKMLYL